MSGKQREQEDIQKLKAEQEFQAEAELKKKRQQQELDEPGSPQKPIKSQQSEEETLQTPAGEKTVKENDAEAIKGQQEGQPENTEQSTSTESLSINYANYGDFDYGDKLPHTFPVTNGNWVGAADDALAYLDKNGINPLHVVDKIHSDTDFGVDKEAAQNLAQSNANLLARGVRIDASGAKNFQPDDLDVTLKSDKEGAVEQTYKYKDVLEASNRLQDKIHEEARQAKEDGKPAKDIQDIYKNGAASFKEDLMKELGKSNQDKLTTENQNQQTNEAGSHQSKANQSNDDSSAKPPVQTSSWMKKGAKEQAAKKEDAVANKESATPSAKTTS